MAKVLVNAGNITHAKPLSTFYVIISVRIYIYIYTRLFLPTNALFIKT